MQADTARLYWDEVSAEDFCPSGWRLPTSVEWMSLFKAMNYRASNASVMRLQGAAIGSSVWWTSSESGADSVQVAYVNYHPMSYEAAQRFETFGVNTTTKTYPHSARCVKDEL